MIFRQITHDDLGCASYLIGDEQAGVAAVVDPKLDVGEYLDLARYLGVRIQHILETHNHADHVSGHGRLVAATGATVHVHRLADPAYARAHVLREVRTGEVAEEQAVAGQDGPCAPGPGQVEARRRAGALVVDVRTDLQFDEAHIPGALCVTARRAGFGSKWPSPTVRSCSSDATTGTRCAPTTWHAPWASPRWRATSTAG